MVFDVEEIRRVLHLYQIIPQSITKVTDHVYKIYDGHHYYALKKSVLTSDTVRGWEFVYHQAHHLYLPDVLPVLMPKSRKLYVEYAGHIYYLSPWIEQREYRLTALFHAIGYIHAKTKRSYRLDQEKDLVRMFTQYKEHCQQHEQKWLAYIDLFEQKRYMSPFDLQVCTHFREISVVFQVLYERIDAFLDLMKEEEKWSYSLCHGNLRCSHFLYDQKGYLINWEHARFEHPIVDLSRFFKQEIIESQLSPDSMIEAFSVYMEENKLQLSELYLLIIYLLDPAHYMRQVQSYVDRPKYDSMINQVIPLEPILRQLQFGLQFSEHVKDTYEFLIFDEDLESL